MKKENIRKIVATICSVLTVAVVGLVCLCACNPTTSNNVGEVEQMSMETTIKAQHGIRLARSEAVTADDGTVSQTITATVYPESAYNKSVVWSIAWASSCSDDISDYLTLSNTNSNTVTVRCHQAFNTQAIVTVKSAIDDNVSATVTVDYRKRVVSTDVQIVPSYILEDNEGWDWQIDTFILIDENHFTVDPRLPAAFVFDEANQDNIYCQLVFDSMQLTNGTLDPVVSSLVLTFNPEAVAFANNNQCFTAQNIPSLTLTKDVSGDWKLDNFRNLYQFDFSNRGDVAFLNYLSSHSGLRLTVTFGDGSSFYRDFRLTLGTCMQNQFNQCTPQSVSASTASVVF